MRILLPASIRAGSRSTLNFNPNLTRGRLTSQALRPTKGPFKPSFQPPSLPKFYSTENEPLIRITTTPAPSSGHIRILSLNRPAARNAISRALLTELHDAIDDIHAEYTTDGAEVARENTTGALPGPTRAVVIASDVDSCFCAGADLKERAGMSPEETQAFLTLLRQTFTALSTLPIPSISAISSLALGGGLELALCTDFRIVSSNAVLGLPETRIAIVPGAGGTYRLPALIGPSRAKNMILTGRRVGASQAEFWGLVDHVVVLGDGSEDGSGSGNADAAVDLIRAREEVLDAAVDMAQMICTGGPVAIRAALAAVRGSEGGEKVENAMYERVVGTEDRNEALRAFREKRVPVFKGR